MLVTNYEARRLRNNCSEEAGQHTDPHIPGAVIEILPVYIIAPGTYTCLSSVTV